jgi:L-galactonate dehydratase
MATGAVVNAIWDLWARFEKKPVWRLVCEMPPEDLVKLIDFRYIVDVMTPEEALKIFKDGQEGKEQRIQDALANKAVPAYTTSAGWLGYSDDKVRSLLNETLKEGFRFFKMKVGGNIDDDKRKLEIARSVIGYDGVKLMVDANQVIFPSIDFSNCEVWDVPEAIEYMTQLAKYQPWFIEEPTSPDDILGHATIRKALKPYGVGVATGEQCQNRVIWKQLFQADAIDIAQIDACRLGGVNEVLAVLLMAKKYVH